MLLRTNCRSARFLYVKGDRSMPLAARDQAGVRQPPGNDVRRKPAGFHARPWSGGDARSARCRKHWRQAERRPP